MLVEIDARAKIEEIEQEMDEWMPVFIYNANE